MAKRNKSDFFVATQIELFLLIVFIVLLSAHFLDDKNAVLLDENDELKSRITKLENDIKTYRAKIDSLSRELSKIKNLDIWPIIKEKLDKPDSHLDETVGTGLGNCLGSGFLANVYCFPADTIEIRFVTSLTLSEQINFNQGQSKRYCLNNFLPVAQKILDYSITRDCRYPIRIIDTDDLSKADLKRYTKILGKYFFYQLGW